VSRKPTKKSLTHHLDRVFSEIVRSQGHCDRCKRSDVYLNCAHIATRTNRRLRWELLNAMCLCVACHNWWHDYPTLATAWLEENFSEKAEYVRVHQREIAHRSIPDLQDLLADLRSRFHNMELPHRKDKAA